MNQRIDKLLAEVAPYRNALLNHPIYNDLKSLEDFRIFMEQHVYAVWDFMTLLKALQLKLTGVSIPWVPSDEPMVTRLINDIVLAEESDEDGQGGYCSHFELYLRAMKEAGADTSKISDLIESIKSGITFEEVLENAYLSSEVKHFLQVNYAVVQSGKPHQIAASFTLGREELIPDLFRQLVNDLIQSKPGQLKTLEYYFERHIHLDEDHHGPLAMKMLAHLCGDNEQKWNETKQAAIEALEARKVLWDGIHAAVRDRVAIENPIH
ncbi:DUF3050 domain-containing protein [Belliella kenyensis]|uniref:DUF3050 domain-containing protein n=1 Tax=Belliella kenyensis TaxID=1472724 RepID=A0ABV8EI16_9BACT|nr:DUF3050 domain-containing protein [Belliella kenyensis]MCH7401379.1 DUF3050 domain-containing protein [Belliella kenyensis]MDN3602822.1 DUF3050 domain-containing protein [Belliella kenyensis]